ncbi:MAG: acyltransferase [Pseudanabaena sp. ELA645]|jgi:fucose 4-O-acetylase-like acetyltransferase
MYNDKQNVDISQNMNVKNEINMRRHISGFDYLRAFFAILVVVWHAGGVSFLGKINPYLQNLVNIFYYNICLLAVPVFFSISLHLFYEKQLVSSTSFPRKKFMSLIRLYGIWMLIGIMFNSLLSRGNYLLTLLDVNNLLITIVKGSRAELFFLFSLIIISYLCFCNSKYFLTRKHSLRTQLILLLMSLLLLIFVSLYTLKTGTVVFSAYWNPICFIPYIFSASILVLVNENKESGLTKYFYERKFLFVIILIACFILSSWLEWQIFNAPSIFGGYLLPPYARVSLVIGSFLICYCAILYKGKSSNLIDELSQESLGIYLLHGYFLFLIGFLVSRLQTLQFFQVSVGIILALLGLRGLMYNELRI